MMVSTSSEKYEDKEYPVIRMFLSAPLIIDCTTFMVVLALIENDGGAVTTKDTLSASPEVIAFSRSDTSSAQSGFDNSGQPFFIIGTALAVPFAISLLTVLKRISLFILPPDIDHLPAP